MAVMARPYAGDDDLARMMAALAAHPEFDRVHSGDLVWHARRADHAELGDQIHLWEDHDQVVAWT